MRILYIVLKVLFLLLTFVGAAMTFLNNVIAKFSQLLGITDDQVKTYGLLVFVVSVILLMSLSVIQDILKEINRPKISPIGEPVWEKKGFSGNIVREALSIDFINSGHEIAPYVTAHIKWKNMGGGDAHKNNGRWHKTNRQIKSGQPLEHIDILPNGERYKLHFAIKSVDGSNMYAWFRENDEEGVPFLLDQDEYEVEIYLMDGTGSKTKTFVYIVKNKKQTSKKEKVEFINQPITEST